MHPVHPAGGHITEWAATLLAWETACLSLADRRAIDVELAADPVALEQMGIRELVAIARRRAAELDPASVVARTSKAEGDRGVTIRPAPDTMTRLTGHLPLKEGVAVYAALRAEADAWSAPETVATAARSWRHPRGARARWS